MCPHGGTKGTPEQNLIGISKERLSLVHLGFRPSEVFGLAHFFGRCKRISGSLQTFGDI